MSSQLGAIADLIVARTGIALRGAQMLSLPHALRRATGTRDPAEALERLREEAVDGEVMRAVVDEVTVGETSFARERAQLDEIDWRRLAGGPGSGRGSQLRVWSAGCASGEESYTLALLACEALATDRPALSVVGTDISASALAAGDAAVYDPRSLRSLDDRLVARYFERRPGGHAVGPLLRRLVSFDRHNLARAEEPPGGRGRFDLVVCRNVLIYLEPCGVEHALRLLTEALAPGGMLILGVADRLCLPSAGVGDTASAPRGPRSAVGD